VTRAGLSTQRRQRIAGSANQRFSGAGQAHVDICCGCASRSGLAIRFGGNDTVDSKQVDWFELTDSQDRKFRLAVTVHSPLDS